MRCRMVDPTHSQNGDGEDRLDPGLLEGMADPAREFQDESLAPEVDYDLLRALVRKEVTEQTARAIYHLIHSFKSWNEAHAQLLIEEFRRTQGPLSTEVPEEDHGTG